MRVGAYLRAGGAQNILPMLRATDAWGSPPSPSPASLACRLPAMVLRPQIIVTAAFADPYNPLGQRANTVAGYPPGFSEAVSASGVVWLTTATLQEDEPHREHDSYRGTRDGEAGDDA